MPPLLDKPKVKIGTSVDKKKRPLDPSWGRDVMEGGVDAILGALGVGPDTKMNQAGQLGMAALPLMGGIKGVGLASRINSVKQLEPTAEEVESLLGQMTSRLREIPNSKNIPIAPSRFPNGRFEGTLSSKLTPADFPPQNRVAMFGNAGVMDEAGRTIAPPQAKPDEAYLAHVSSSRNKNELPKKSNLAPSSSTVERMMNKYKK